jgi:hypothetical protein
MEAQFINKKIVASAPSQLTKRNVLLFVRPGCFACAANMSLYRSIASIPGRRFRLVAIGPTGTATEKYLSDNNVQPDEVKLSDFARLGVVATPTILLTDQTGVVRRAWIGTLEDPRTRDFLNAISE